MALKYIVVIAAVCTLGFGRIIKLDPCGVSQASICEIKEARVEPCGGSQTNTQGKYIMYPEQIKLLGVQNVFCYFPVTARNAVTDFTAQNLSTNVNYNGHPYEGFGSSEACLFTKCPTEAGVSQTMDYALKIGKKLPKGTFTFEWKVWNVENPNEVCCFMPTIRLKN